MMRRDLVVRVRRIGWEWGGDGGKKDYMHFSLRGR
jgi:hypothetical protein